jgi:2',3'-cyclic-nucleotide 2'-phosphodiesterase (5'-nucleotidase family)
VKIPLAPDHDLILLGLLYKDDAAEFHDYGYSRDPIATTRKLIEEFEASDPARLRSYVALTHQHLVDDEKFGEGVKRIPLIMGGHDHSVRYHQSVKKSLIVKAMSDGRTIRINWVVELTGQHGELVKAARTADAEAQKTLVQWLMKELCLPVFQYITTGSISRKGNQLTAKEQLALKDFVRPHTTEQEDADRGIPQPPRLALAKSGDRDVVIFSLLINPLAEGFFDLVPADPEIQALIARHQPIRSATGTAIIKAPVELVIRDNVVRRFSTTFGNIVADVLLGRFDDKPDGVCDVSVINSGSFRIDRDIKKNEPITAQTLCDIFFHANNIQRFSLIGETLLKVLGQSLELRNSNPDEGHGEFLQIGGLAIEVASGGGMTVKLVTEDGLREPIDPARTYSVATTTYVGTRCGKYKHFFEAQQGDLPDDSVEEAVTRGLKKLDTLRRRREWSKMLHRICEQRWIWR